MIDWVFIPAVKDASEESETSKGNAIDILIKRILASGTTTLINDLENLKQKTESEYEKIQNNNKAILQSAENKITTLLQNYNNNQAGMKLDWSPNFKIDKPTAIIRLIENGIENEIDKFGHGLQRCFIIALLMSLVDNSTVSKTLILGIEEPELYQHPPQINHLARQLEKLSSNSASQVILTSHSPFFVSRKNFEKIYIIKKLNHGSSSIISYNFEKLKDIYNKDCPVGLQQNDLEMFATLSGALQTNAHEMFFAPFLVFC